jgi:hypothetical protein
MYINIKKKKKLIKITFNLLHFYFRWTSPLETLK